ncbi:FG-GAP repeat domain-containing protein [Streptomyces sp. BI20]|uniref:FG-GAP repeat domain-containing protein n=1 Tax=Streptomyces sp. BI20 TaxID=3403460 RepID=UPI003C71AE03
MFLTRHQRAGRLAACTALVLSAGMFASAAAVAAPGPVTPVPSAKSVEPRGAGGSDDVPSAKRTTGAEAKLALRGDAKAGAGKAGKAAKDGRAAALAAEVPVAPRHFDVNSDGVDDLVVRDLNGGYFVSLSNGDGTETPFDISGAVGENGTLKDVIPAGDLNGDGQPEVLALSVTGNLSLSTVGSTGSGSTVWTGRGWTIFNKVVGTGDITGDNIPDLVARTPSGDLYLYAGTGNVSGGEPFSGRVKISSGWGGYDQLVGGGDFTLDGKPDLVTRDSAGDLWLHASQVVPDANATFAPRVKIGHGWRIYNQLSVVNDYDGTPVVFARQQSGQTYLYPLKAVAELGDRITYGTGYESVNLIAGQGGNADHGRSDLIGRDAAGTLFGYYFKEDGNFFPGTAISDTGAFAGTKLYNSSSTDNFNSSQLFFGSGSDLYEATEPTLVGAGWADTYDAVVGPGDMNGDGRGDLIGRDKTGKLWLHTSQGTGTTFNTRVQIGTGWQIYNQLLGAGDFTGDGRADLLARNTAGELYIYAGTGNGTSPLAAKVKIGTGWTFPKLTATGDITGDGLGDLFAVDSAGNSYRYPAAGSAAIGMDTLGSRTNMGGGWQKFNAIS